MNFKRLLIDSSLIIIFLALLAVPISSVNLVGFKADTFQSEILPASIERIEVGETSPSSPIMMDYYGRY